MNNDSRFKPQWGHQLYALLLQFVIPVNNPTLHKHFLIIITLAFETLSVTCSSFFPLFCYCNKVGTTIIEYSHIISQWFHTIY